MKLLACLAFAMGVSAAPAVRSWSSCLTQSRVDTLIAGSITYLEHTNIAVANATAHAIFATDIVEYGDSINSLRSAPLGTIVEDGLAEYTGDTLAEPGTPSITTLNVVWDCSQVAWHWEFDGLGEYRIRGFTLMQVNSEGLIYRQDVEFNSLAWAEDFGFTVIPPTSGPFAPTSK